MKKRNYNINLIQFCTYVNRNPNKKKMENNNKFRKSISFKCNCNVKKIANKNNKFKKMLSVIKFYDG